MASKRQIEAGGAFVRIFADDSPLRRALKTASERIKKFGQSFIAAGKVIGAGLGVAAVAVVVPSVALVITAFVDTVRLPVAVP